MRHVIGFGNPKRQRINKAHYGFVECFDRDMVFNLETRKWIRYSEQPNPRLACTNQYFDDHSIGVTSTPPCCSLKAYKRMLRKNPFLRGNSMLVLYPFRKYGLFGTNKCAGLYYIYSLDMDAVVEQRSFIKDWGMI